MKRVIFCISLVFVCLFTVSNLSWADDNELEKLRRKNIEQDTIIKQQQETIQQLLERMSELESKVTAPQKRGRVTTERVSFDDEELPTISPDAVEGKSQYPIIEWGGYIDVGYVDAADSGTSSSSSTVINSRGDNITSAGLDGDSTFLINEISLDMKAHVSERSDVIVSFDILPRDLSVTSSGGSASSDTVELDRAYVVYAPDLKTGPLVDALFEDLTVSLGKFESPMGIEYRQNRSPDRVNISRSHLSIYTTGYPVGVRARGKLFKKKLQEHRNSNVTYNVVLANSDPFLSIAGLGDGDVDDNNERTIMGRLSYGLDVFDGFFETGVSLLHGARLGIADRNVESQTINADIRFERGPLTIRGEWDHADEDRPPGGSGVIFDGIYGEVFYVVERPDWLPKWAPMISVTPYYRYDTRDLVSTPVTGSSTIIDVKRHTMALRYIPASGNIFKAEYQINEESTGAKVNDNLFLMSYIREF